MLKLAGLAERIEELRRILHVLTEGRDKLVDPEIVATSQRLDALLTEYENAVKKYKGR